MREHKLLNYIPISKSLFESKKPAPASLLNLYLSTHGVTRHRSLHMFLIDN